MELRGRLPSGIAIAALAVALLAGGFAIGYGVHDDSGTTSASPKPSVLGKVFERTTTTSAGTPTTVSAQAPPTSQAPTPATTVTTAAAAATVAATPTTVATPPATVAPSNACGTGSANATLAATTFPQHEAPNTDYETDATVSVANNVSKAIQIDALTLRMTLQDGRTEDVVFNGAVGTVVQPGNTGKFTVKVDTGKTPAQSVAINSFAFHTAGQPQCTGKPA